MSNIMTTEDVAQYLRMHPATVRKHAESGEIPALRIGRVFRFRKDWIDKWLEGKVTDVKNSP